MTQSPAAGSAAANQYGVFAVRYPSEKQRKFVARLAATKALTPELSAQVAEVAAGTLNLKATSRLIDALTELPDRGARPVRVASDKQVDLITRLGVEKEGGAVYIQTQLNSLRVADITELPIKEASNLIGVLMDLPRAARKATADRSEPEAGMYRGADGTIYRVYLGQQSGRMLVKRVVGSKEDGYSYEYVGSAAFKLPVDARRMELEEAKAWGRMTGTCCVCAARLDDPRSVDAGIGPVCAKRV